jgi:diaminopimelate epimerase
MIVFYLGGLMLKVHGTGNTFYILENIVESEMTQLAIDLCKDGTDGVLYVCDSDEHLSKMRIFNSDGSEPEMCGNGLRCYARYILEKQKKKHGTIETLNAAYEVAYIEDFYGQVGISINLYPVIKVNHAELESFDERYDSCFEFYTVSNPHVVSIIEEKLTAEKLTDIGQHGNDHFSDGINVNMMHVLDCGKVYVQTFERGVGITKSCGTGMTSSSVHYARHFDYFDKTIEVYNDGGLILCEVSRSGEDYKVKFTGNATYIAEYKDREIIRTYDKESQAYDVFLQASKKASLRR